MISREHGLDIFVHAIDRIYQGWTQQYPAINANGEPVFETDNSACAWCIVGALNAACAEVAPLHGKVDMIPQPIIDAIIQAIGKTKLGSLSIASWNDRPERTQQDILGVLEMARSNFIILHLHS